MMILVQERKQVNMVALWLDRWLLGRQMVWGQGLRLIIGSFLLRFVATYVDEQVAMEMSDESLVALAQSRQGRDDRPFQELFRRHYQMVWRVCFGIIRNQEEAEDLTQEVFFKVYRSLKGFKGDSAFKTWLYRIAVNTTYNEIRRRKRRPQLQDEHDFMEWGERLPAGFSAEKAVEQRWQMDQLVAALASVRPEEVELIQLKDVEQRSYAEIAEILEISLSAAKMRVQRARLAVQAAYQLQGMSERPAYE